MGKSTISMAIFNSYVKLPEGMWQSDKIYCNQHTISFELIIFIINAPAFLDYINIPMFDAYSKLIML